MGAATLRAQDTELGSTATLEQLQKGFLAEPSAKKVPSIPREADLATEPAAAPQPRLQYRFWPDEPSLKPGRAIVHLDRALVFYQLNNKTALQGWMDYQVALGDANPEPTDLAMRLAIFDNVNQELNRFAACEDSSWDLRLRDLKGLDVYGFLLPEVQQYRELARLLRFRALEQLGRRDFDGAVNSIRCGYRLAAFVRQGETVIQQLVGIAIEGIMQEVVEDAIRTPGCPNLYFALATVPHERQSMLRALEFELSSFKRAFPILDNPAEQSWEPKTWQQQWAKTAEDLSKLLAMGMSSENGLVGPASGLSLLLAAEVANNARGPRQRLVQSGLAQEKVAAMCPEQVLAVDAAQRLRQIGDELLAACLQPSSGSKKAVDAAMERLNQEAKGERFRDIGTLLSSLLLTAVNAAVAAEVRVNSTHHRLLTIEAVRHFAATHDGQLPKTLSELTELLPQVDLHTGELIGYELKSGPEGEWAEFSIGLPVEELRIRRMKFRRSP
jgi:hypothetical protein